MKQSSVIVVGGGHAGIEAASAARRMGARVLLVTLRRDAIGALSCNPAMGGLGKGHLIREIDAMDGVIGRASDRAGIQYRLLNRSKGPAVQGPRAQVDRNRYKMAAQDAVTSLGIEVLEAQAADLIVRDGQVRGVVLDDASEVEGDAVILTTGTFLNGVIHMGTKSRSGGRIGEAPSIRLAERLYALGLPMGRLKTGTPPRLDRYSIDWSALEAQPGDDTPVMLSFLSDQPALQQVSCAITHTNERTHEIIRANLHRSAMYSGRISGKGPRYCPSIEDKIARFADKESHQIFLEPETLDGDTVYPNGISTSLPVEVQEDYVRSIRGLEDARIVQPGYAIEYDYVDPRALDRTLQLRDLPGLWLAGQINGTTGYEEAGAQGLVAGLNAAAFAGDREPVRFSRTDSYIGVMIDDLVSRGVTEPYRMFTSRAEYRLSLRADNADQRLTPMAIELGVAGEGRRRTFEQKITALDDAISVMQSCKFSPKDARAVGIPLSQDGAKRSAFELLTIPNVAIAQITELCPELEPAAPETLEQIARQALYANYLERQEREADRVRQHEALAIPQGFDFSTVSGLSSELRAKLTDARPGTIAEAGKLEGMTPVALNTLIYRLKWGGRSETRAV